jgi:RNA polymerase sigma-70 factor (ECF subfamily)
VDHTLDPAETEQRLLVRVREGRPGAFDELVVRHRLAVYRVARRVLGTHEAADEAAQETFVRAWRAIGSFRGDSSVSTWLIRIALNVSRTMAVSRPRLEPLAASAEPFDPRPGAEAQVAREEAGARLKQAVALLPPRQREVVTLKVFSDMTYDDVASVMGLSVGAVKAHFHQAVSNLRRHMAAREAKG